MFANQNQPPFSNSNYIPANLEIGSFSTNARHNPSHEPMMPIHVAPHYETLWYEFKSSGPLETVPEAEETNITPEYRTAGKADETIRSSLAQSAWDGPSSLGSGGSTPLPPPKNRSHQVTISLSPHDQGEVNAQGSRSTKTPRMEGYLTPGSVSTTSVIRMGRNQARDTTPDQLCSKVTGLCQRTRVVRLKSRKGPMGDGKGVARRKKRGQDGEVIREV